MPREAHWLTDTSLRRTGYRVLSYLYAAYEWDGLRRDDDPDVLDTFLEFADEEVSESLVSLAAVARAADDELSNLAQVDQAFANGIGWLEEDAVRKPLRFREACNKIIHANKVEWDFARAKENPLYRHYYASMGYEIEGDFKTPALIVWGPLRNKPWEARVELVPFIVGVADWNAYRYRFA